MAPRDLIAPSGDTIEVSNPIANEDISFRLVKDSIATEGNNFLIFANNGTFCFVNLMLVNAVFKKHQLGLTVKIYDEKFNCQTITRTFDGGSALKLSSDKLSATFAENQVTYDPEARTYRIVLKEATPSKEGPQIAGDWLDATFTADSPSFKLGTGSIYYGKEKEDYAFLAFSMPRAKVVGRATVEGKEYNLEGFGFVTKNLSNMTPHKLANSFQHCKLITPELTLALCKIETPKAFNKAVYTWGYLVENGELIATTTKTEVIILEPGVIDPETKYTVPAKVNFKWQGKTKNNEDFSADVIVEIKKENLMCRFDVLGHIPAVFRMVVQTLIARPFFYQYYQLLEGTITIGGNSRVVQGRCLHEYHFIND